MQRLTNHINKKLANWYLNAKRDHGIVGSGSVRFENELAIIDYIENGVSKTWSMVFYPEYISNGLDWVYDVWMEEAK